MTHPENPPATPPDTITIHFFDKEELALMQKCLQATAFGEFFRSDSVSIVTGFNVSEYAELSEKFSAMTEFSKNDFVIIDQAVGFIASYFSKRSHELSEFLNVRRLHLLWFGSHLPSYLMGWPDYVEDSGWTLYRAQNNLGVESWF